MLYPGMNGDQQMIPTAALTPANTSDLFLTPRIVMQGGTHPPLVVGRKKRRGSKVRTGCYTCKKRRVKCDEGKPYCDRCIRFGIQCDGYPSTSKQLAPVSRPLAPKSQTSSKSSVLISSIYTPHSGPRFEDAQEGRCFRIYIEEMATQIKGPFSTSLWERLIPQTSEAEPFIRHAVIAIGAMSKIQRDIGQEKDRLSSAQLIKNSDYTYALRQYDKALRGMRAAIAEGKQDMRKALLACLLVFCFENMSGKPGSAVANAASGLMLLHQWMLATMKQKVPFFASNEWQKHQIEEDIMTALAALDLHVMFFSDSRPDSVHRFYVDGSNMAIPKMPEALTTLRMVRHYWSLIMRRNFHFIRTALNLSKAEELAKPWIYTDDGPWEDGANLYPGANMFITPKEPPMEMFPESLRYREEVKRWSRASAALFERVWRSGTQEEKTVVCLLQIHELMAHIMLAGAFFSTQTEYDEFLPEFQTVMSLVEYVYPHLVDLQNGQSLYKFDLGIVIALYMVGVRCRDKATRDRAVDLINLHKYYREGMWDTGGAGMMVRWLTDIEDGLRDENGNLAEDKRVFVTSAYMDLSGRRGVVGCTQRSKEGLLFREKVITW